MIEIILFQHLIDFIDIAHISVTGDSKVHHILNILLRSVFIIDTGQTRLSAQIFGLELILPAIFYEMRFALAELEIDLLPDALLPDVKHSVIVERPCVPV